MKEKILKRKDAGFTLLEVMVALAVIGVALVAVLRSLAMSVNASNESRNISVATFLAKGLMAEIENRGFPDLEETSGDFKEEYPGFRWERNVSDTGMEDLVKVTARVIWQDGAHEKKVELVTLITEKK